MKKGEIPSQNRTRLKRKCDESGTSGDESAEAEICWDESAVNRDESASVAAGLLAYPSTMNVPAT